MFSIFLRNDTGMPCHTDLRITRLYGKTESRGKLLFTFLRIMSAIDVLSLTFREESVNGKPQRWPECLHLQDKRLKVMSQVMDILETYSDQETHFLLFNTVVGGARATRSEEIKKNALQRPAFAHHIFPNLTKNLFLSNGPKHLGSPVRVRGAQIKDVIIKLSGELKESGVREINIVLFHPFKTLRCDQ